MFDSYTGAMVDRAVEAATARQVPIQVTCPGLGCGDTARRMPDGRIVCERTGWVYGPDGQPLRDPDPDLGGLAVAVGWGS